MIFRRASRCKVVSFLKFGAAGFDSVEFRSGVGPRGRSNPFQHGDGASGVVMRGKEQFLHDLSQK